MICISSGPDLDAAGYKHVKERHRVPGKPQRWTFDKSTSPQRATGSTLLRNNPRRRPDGPNFSTTSRRPAPPTNDRYDGCFTIDPASLGHLPTFSTHSGPGHPCHGPWLPSRLQQLATLAKPATQASSTQCAPPGPLLSVHDRNPASLGPSGSSRSADDQQHDFRAGCSTGN